MIEWFKPYSSWKGSQISKWANERPISRNPTTWSLTLFCWRIQSIQKFFVHLEDQRRKKNFAKWKERGLKYRLGLSPGSMVGFILPNFVQLSFGPSSNCILWTFKTVFTSWLDSSFIELWVTYIYEGLSVLPSLLQLSLN